MSPCVPWSMPSSARCLAAGAQLAPELLADFTWPKRLLWIAAAARPNVVFLLPDQLRAQALTCMGNPDAITPELPIW